MKNEGNEYLIIGNSTAAIGAIEGIRKIDGNTPILLLSRESYSSYSRPLISYLLAGEIKPETMYWRPRDFFDRNKAVENLGVEVVSVDTKARIARTSAGNELAFRKLLIATGGRPFVPPLEGADSRGVFTFVSWGDAKAIDDYIRAHGGGESAAKAVVIGSGLIGIKAAEALRARGLAVFMVELADRALPLLLNREASQIVEEAIRQAGVELVCSTTVSRIIADDGHVRGVELKTGREIACGMVVAAIGVVPETGLAKGTPIKTDKGILIDEHCETSVKGIYAAGDVSQAADSLTGVSRPIPIFPNAFRQGNVAGINMAGGSATLSANFAMNSVQVFGMPTISFGLSTASGGEFEVLERRTGTSDYQRIVLRNNRIVGALFVGAIDRAGIIAGLLREQVDVSDVKNLLLTDEFGILSLPSDYRKHVVKGEGIEV